MDGYEQGAPESAEQHAHRLLSELANPSAFRKILARQLRSSRHISRGSF